MEQFRDPKEGTIAFIGAYSAANAVSFTPPQGFDSTRVVGVEAYYQGTNITTSRTLTRLKGSYFLDEWYLAYSSTDNTIVIQRGKDTDATTPSGPAFVTGDVFLVYYRPLQFGGIGGVQYVTTDLTMDTTGAVTAYFDTSNLDFAGNYDLKVENVFSDAQLDKVTFRFGTAIINDAGTMVSGQGAMLTINATKQDMSMTTDIVVYNLNEVAFSTGDEDQFLSMEGLRISATESDGPPVLGKLRATLILK